MPLTLTALKTIFNETLNANNSIPDCAMAEMQAAKILLNKLDAYIAMRQKNSTLSEEVLVAECITILQSMLLVRTVLTRNLGYDYFQTPFTEANQQFLSIATIVAKNSNKAICKVLDQTIEKTVLPGNYPLKDITEDNGKFAPELYIRSSAENRLIPVLEVLTYAAANTGHLFKRNGEVFGSFRLTATDLKNLRTVAPPISEHYFQALYNLHTAKDNTLHAALQTFSDALLASSKRGTGKEVLADFSQLIEPTKKFYQQWMAITNTERATVGSQTIKINSQDVPLTMVLNTLFLYILFDQTKTTTFSAAELADIEKANLFLCTHQFSGYLDQFCTNKDTQTILLSISLAQNSVNLTRPDFEGMNAELKGALTRRTRNAPLPDSDRLYAIAHIESQLPIHSLLSEKLSILDWSNLVGNIEHLQVILCSKLYQLFKIDLSTFFKYIKNKLIDIITNEKELVSILLILEKSDWGEFIAALDARIEIVTRNEYKLLKVILSDLPEDLWVDFFKSMRRNFKKLFPNGYKFADCIKNSKDIFIECLFDALNASNNIDYLMDDVIQLAAILIELDVKFWNSFFSILINKHVLHTLIPDKKALNELRKIIYCNSFPNEKWAIILESIGFENLKVIFNKKAKPSPKADNIIKYANTQSCPQTLVDELIHILHEYAFPGLFSLNWRHVKFKQDAKNMIEYFTNHANLSIVDCLNYIMTVKDKVYYSELQYHEYSDIKNNVSREEWECNHYNVVKKDLAQSTFYGLLKKLIERCSLECSKQQNTPSFINKLTHLKS